MRDEKAIDFLVEKLGSQAALAAAVGVKRQNITNWYDRGISATKRPLVWSMINDNGGNLPREWLYQRKRLRK